MRNPLRISVVTAVVLGALAVAAVSLAANYHFVGSQSCTQSTDTVTCSFSVAGLGNASTATAQITAPFHCAKTTNGQQYVQPGGLASSDAQTFAVRNGRIDVTNLSLSASCPDQFHAVFEGPVSVYVNGVFVGTIPIS
jgi:hypothetical protein